MLIKVARYLTEYYAREREDAHFAKWAWRVIITWWIWMSIAVYFWQADKELFGDVPQLDRPAGFMLLVGIVPVICFAIWFVWANRRKK